MTVTVKKVGGSVAVLIPKAVAQEMALAAGTALELTTADGAIVMRKPQRDRGSRPRRPIGEIVAGIKSASYRRQRRNLGDAGRVGREPW